MISVNDVYQTVLTILNKEQRGYLDAEEFNHLARLAQREIFESYFTRASATPNTTNDVVLDPKMFIEEKISYYYKETTIAEDENATDSFFPFPDDFYRLGVVTTDQNIVIDQISHKEARYVKLSPLTSPTEKQPVYVLRGEGIKVFPDSPDEIAISTVNMEYMRIPELPEIVQTVDEDGDIVTNLVASKDFDLHNSEFTDIVIKICAYAGVVVRAPEVTNFAQGKSQEITATEQ